MRRPSQRQARAQGSLLRLRNPALALGAVSALMCASAFAAEPSLEPLEYRNPGLVVDLGVGLWAYPIALDHDGDGDLDLLVSCPDKPQNGVWFFENPGPRGEKFPVFKPPRRLGGPAPKYLTLSWVNGEPRLFDRNQELTAWKDGDWKATRAIYPRDRVAPIKYLRSNTWSLTDYDADGKHDLIVGHDSWDNFGSFDTNDWWKNYNVYGAWTGGALRGNVYWLKNDGSDAEPKYGLPEPIVAGSTIVETYGAPSPQFADFDGDADLDLLCGEFLDGFTYYRNSGTRAAPKYDTGVRLPVRMDLQMVVPHAVDWDADGDADLIVGDEDGRVALIENLGMALERREPNFAAPRYFQQQAHWLDAGALATPVGCDWDGDGDDDLVCGNTAGYFLYFENLSGKNIASPRWASPRKLEVEGVPFRIQAGANGSIQGPAEAKWGYTTQSVVDWDHDGRLDIVYNSIWGRVGWLRNVGSPTAPKLAAPQQIDVAWPGEPPKPTWMWYRPKKPGELVTQWRTTPAVVDLNQDGLLDLVMLDHEGFLAFFERQKRGDQTILAAAQRVLLDEQGQPLNMNAALGGRSGRRKLCLVDWDGDGRLDLFANSQNSAFQRQLAHDEKGYRFAAPKNVSDRNIEGHDTSPTTVDWNGDGIRDLVIGAEDGRLYYLANPR